jgi:hypothetical protein
MGIAASGNVGVALLVTRPDVLVHAEEVVWVIFCLDGREEFVIVTLGRADAIFAFVHHEIHIFISERGTELGPIGPLHAGTAFLYVACATFICCNNNIGGTS